MLLACDRHHDLVEVPLVSGSRQPAADLVGEVLAELEAPLEHGLVADHDAANCQDLVHVAQAEWEAEVESHSMADDLGREAIAGVAGAGRCRHWVQPPGPARSGKPTRYQVANALRTSPASRCACVSACRACSSWVASSSSGPRWPARPTLACSALRRDAAPWARRASVVARPSHWRWMWNTSPWQGVSPQAPFYPARKPCPASAMV